MAGGDQKARARGQLKVFFDTDRFGSKAGIGVGVAAAWPQPVAARAWIAPRTIHGEEHERII